MAEGRDFVRRKDPATGNYSIYIEGTPTYWTSEQRSAFADTVAEATGGKGLTGHYSNALEAIRNANTLPYEDTTTPADLPDGSWEETPAVEEEVLPEGSWEEPETPGRANTRVPLDLLSGAAGGVVRDKGPLAATTAAGALVGSVVPGVGTAAGAVGGLAVGAGMELVDFVKEIMNDVGDKEYATANEAWSDAFDAIGIDEPENKAESVVAAMGSGAIDAGLGLSLGRLLKGMLPKLSNAKGVKLATKIADVLSEAPAQEYASSIGAAGASQTAAELTQDSEKLPNWAKTAIPVAAGLGGAFLGGGITSGLAKKQAAQGTPLPTTDRQAIEAAERLGTGPTGLDIAAESRGSRLADWAKKKRTKGTQAVTGQLSHDINNVRMNAMDSLGKEYGVELDGLGSATNPARQVASRFIEKHQNNVHKYATAKKDIIERVGGEPLGPNYVVDIGADGNVVRVDFDPQSQADFVVSPSGEAIAVGTRTTPPVDVSETKNLIDGYDRLYAPSDKPIPNEYQPFLNNLQRWTSEMEDEGLAGIERLRGRIASYWTDPENSVGELDAKVYRDVYKKLNEDMGKYIEVNGSRADFIEWKNSNVELKKLMDDYDVPALRTALREGTRSPEQVMNLLWDSEPERIKDMVNKLELSGEETNIAEQALMRRMLEASTTPEGPSGNTLASIFQRYSEPIKEVFGDAGYERMEGMKQWLTSTAYHEEMVTGRTIPDRAPNLSAEVPLAGPVAAGAARANPVTVLPAMKLISNLQGAHLKRLTSPKMRNLLVRMAHTEPGTTASENIAKRITAYLKTEDNTPQSVNQLPNLDQRRENPNWQNTTGIPGVE